MIREASEQDILTFGHIGERWHNLTGNPGCFDLQFFIDTWSALIRAGTGRVFIRIGEGDPDEGIGIVTNRDTDNGQLVAVVAFWYLVEQPAGLAQGALYGAAERAMRAAGVRRMYISALLGDRFRNVTDFLSRVGYNPVQLCFSKEL